MYKIYFLLKIIIIIVLLILAGVSISLVVGDNGVLTQSQNASEKTNRESARQAVNLAVVSLNTQFLGDYWTDNINADIRNELSFEDLQTALSNNGFVMVTGSSDKHKVKDGSDVAVATKTGANNSDKVIANLLAATYSSSGKNTTGSATKTSITDITIKQEGSTTTYSFTLEATKEDGENNYTKLKMSNFKVDGID